MAFAPECRRGPVGRSSRLAAPRAESACQPEVPVPGNVWAWVRIRVRGWLGPQVRVLTSDRSSDVILQGGLAQADERKPKHPAGFGRLARLDKASEFRRVFRNPEVSSDALFKVLACRGTAGRARLGLAVSRQVVRRATARNRLKRVIRESFRRHFAGGGPAIDFVVLPRSASATICNRRLFASLEAHWLRILSKTGSEGHASRS